MTSSELTLISHRTCPFVQRAAIVLLEKGVLFERIDIDLSAKPDWFLAVSPTGKVPLLRVAQPDAAPADLFESVPICEFLDETQPGARMHAEDPLVRARQRAWIDFGTTILMDVWPFLNATEQDTATAKATSARLKLEKVENILGSGPYFEEERFGMVDAVYAPIFRFFDALPGKDFSAIFGNLDRIASWRRSLAARESVRRAVRPSFADDLRDHLIGRSALIVA